MVFLKINTVFGNVMWIVIIWIIQGSKATNKVKLFKDNRQTGVRLGGAENLQMHMKPKRIGNNSERLKIRVFISVKLGF